MTKIIRITRHAAQPEQIEALENKFGEVEIEEVSKSLPSKPREAVDRFDELAADTDVVEAVLPTNLLEAILKHSDFADRGGTLIRAEMNREVDENGDATFRFDHYEVVEKVEIVTRPL